MAKKIFNLKTVLIAISLLILIGVVVWQGVNYQGNPDPTAKNLTPGAAILNTAILVFREGLEAILVLSAISLVWYVKNKITIGNQSLLGQEFPL